MGQEPHPEGRDKLQTEGRRDNAAQPLNEAKPNAGAERYPPVDRTDSIKARESRSFEPKAGGEDAPDREQDLSAHFTGPAADPAEGKP